MVRKVESEEWGEPLPPTCDWRKVAGAISPIRNQVSAHIQFNPI
jgi:hypothetical protein